jgi:spore photoproduct lyase
LQFYLNQPATVVYTDYREIIAEIDRRIASQPRRFFRFGTGELGDSLALSASQFFAIRLMKYFANQPQALIELKTKTDRIERILEQPYDGRTVLSWSLNPSIIKRSEERLAATPESRIKAAAAAGCRDF